MAEPLHITVFASNKSKAHIGIDYMPICGVVGREMENTADYEYKDGMLKNEFFSLKLTDVIDCQRCLKKLNRINNRCSE
jgi:hypothetical protein